MLTFSFLLTTIYSKERAYKHYYFIIRGDFSMEFTLSILDYQLNRIYKTEHRGTWEPSADPETDSALG